MNRKADMCAALERKQPAGMVPFWELSFHAWDQLSGKHVVLGREFEALTDAVKDRALNTNAEIFLSISEDLGYAALRLPGGYWEEAPGHPAYFWLPGDWRLRQIEVVRKHAPADLMLIENCGGVMAMPGATEYMEFAYKLIDEPEAIDQLAKQCLENGLRMARRLREVGIEALVTASDIADNRGPYFRPEQMERFVLPYLRKWAAEIKALGAYSILHTDGNIMPCLEAIADSGVNAIQAIDPTAGMDLYETKRQVGDRLCLCGNMDCGLLLTGTPEQVYAAARDLLLCCKPGGGLVFGASNAVQREVPVANYRAMARAWREHGTY